MIHGSTSGQRDICFKMEYIHFGIGLIVSHGILWVESLEELFILASCSLPASLNGHFKAWAFQILTSGRFVSLWLLFFPFFNAFQRINLQNKQQTELM
jgi:hypothetical protein